MKKWINNKFPFILSIAGFDPLNSAGVSTDIRVKELYKHRNLSIITSIVIQDDKKIIKKIDLPNEEIIFQIEFYLKTYPVSIINIGIINNLEILDHIIKLTKGKEIKIIFDPIIKSGDENFLFLSGEQVVEIKKRLNNIYLITPNIPEFEQIFNTKIQDKKEKQIEEILSEVNSKFNTNNILLKGGHSKNKKSYDFLFLSESKKIIKFYSKLKEIRIHGTGSFYNSLISASLINEYDLESSVRKAKKELEKMIDKVKYDYTAL